MPFTATRNTPTADGIRVSPVPRPSTLPNFKPPSTRFTEAPTASEEFHVSAFENNGGRKSKRPCNRSEHRELLRKELEAQTAKINKLEEELEEHEYTAAEKAVRLENIIENQERAIQFRQMHLDTTLDEKDELEKQNKTYEERIKAIRTKALTRKFQSRFWMFLLMLSLVEHVQAGSLMWTTQNIVMPVTTDLVFSNSHIAIGLRVVSTIGALIYFRADKYLRKIPALV